jgi:hypothetical protein
MAECGISIPHREALSFELENTPFFNDDKKISERMRSNNCYQQHQEAKTTKMPPVRGVSVGPGSVRDGFSHPVECHKNTASAVGIRMWAF